MPVLLPFRAWLPAHPAQASLPIGSYSQKQVDEIRKNHPQAFLNVVFPPGTTKSRPEWHQSRKAWEDFKAKRLFLPQPTPAFFLYTQVAGDHTYTGIIGLASTADFDKSIIRRHEDTLRDKEKLLYRYLQILRIQAEPVYLLFQDDEGWTRLLNQIPPSPPRMDFQDILGRRHILHTLSDPQTLSSFTEYFSGCPAFYIADGHHRCAASALCGRETGHQGPESLFLAAVVPMSGIRPDAFSRLVIPYQGAPDVSEILNKAQLHFFIEGPNPSPHPEAYANLCLSGHWYSLTPRHSPVYLFGLMGRVPAFVLNELILKPIFEISDFRSDRRLRYVGGPPDFSTLTRESSTGKILAALTMQPVAMADFQAVSDAHLAMPPKSTWFLPKFLTGLTVYEYHDPA
ncbi:MAG: DUF1015 family protein [Flavobacteriales bacterium]|nr:DUF1015 family protein [Flavobacteriales bacterium]MCX7649022.1 DUF1015 family protein [Flavobacteriales bacterium]MDW8431089.1 DUF1015 family protein [Flavobacteriales bacterium]